MDRGLVTLIGMSIAYLASFIGLGLAWWAWRKRVDDGSGHDSPADPPSDPTTAGEPRHGDAP